MTDPFQSLRDLLPKHDFFVGIDSDGCAFDSMELKHKECFCPNFIRCFGLQGVSKIARETWDFVNLYSTTRGANRFLALLKAMSLLAARPEVAERHVELPDMSAVAAWTERESMLGNPALEALVKTDSSEILARALEWSLCVNRDVAAMNCCLPPFPYMRESLAKLSGRADMMVVSQTPFEALAHEWAANDLDGYLRLIAGQELGKKEEHLKYAAVGKYDLNRILMVGDAPGDLLAARRNGVLYYPINPGGEKASWKRFHDEALERFLDGSYRGAYEDQLVAEFEACLPAEPPW